MKTCQIYYTSEGNLFSAKSINYDIGLISAESYQEMQDMVKIKLIEEIGEDEANKLIVKYTVRVSI
jgi:hypothetical protein